MAELPEVKPQYPDASLEEKILGKTQLMFAPRPALTAAVGGTAGSSYSSAAQDLINNNTQRILDIETALKKLGLIK